ncbi:MAG: hypothetical protein CR974_02255 [Gammaproteobacteria bacterium]|nr:MAG: hypothetical protein CR974_02255 [Gammaproteobacteria bacterium]
MKKLFKFLKILLGLLLSLALLVVLYVNLHPTFGGSPNADSMAKIKQSPYFDGEHFQNLVKTEASTIRVEGDKADKWRLLQNFISPPKGKNPELVHTQKLKAKAIKNGEFIWLGHSTVLFKTDETTIITDPVFNNASPVPFTIEPFAMSNTPTIEDLPFIDIVLISHDHYDHLDYKAIQQLNAKVGHFYVPLGVKAHLLHWGVAATKVSEYDWYEETTANNIRLVFLPSRHFSGRGIWNHRQTLWGSWAVIAPQLKVYFSGDGGYSPEFAHIGQRVGGFDMAFIEDGAYNKRWKDVHMFPEQSAQAGIDVRAKVILPIHWGKFDLSTHQWTEPVRRIKAALNQHNKTVSDGEKIRLATPRIGETFGLTQFPQGEWWTEKTSQP